jgi:uncharacterized protein with ParB-like and HNH nuclease domain
MTNIIPAYRSVQQLLQSQTFSIDEFQREYKWEKENVDELLTDLQEKFFRCYQEADETRKVAAYDDYFLGSIIVSKRNGKNYLIDGQQRVTSLTLLLIYLYRSAHAKNLPESLISSIAPLIYSNNFGTPCFNLDISERLPVLEALFYNTPFSPDGRDESIQNMYARYGDIEDENLAEKLDDALPHFIYWLMTKVGLIEIATDNDNYAYAIFETMNDRGKRLSPVDMLKAYLLAPIEDPAQRRNANQIWKHHVLNLVSWRGEHDPEQDSNSIKAWFRAQYAESTRERKANSEDKDWELIGSEFHRWTRENRERLQLGSGSKNLSLIQNEFPFFANAYQLVLNASIKYMPERGLEAVFFNAHNKFTWQNTVLLAPLCVTDNNDIVRRKLAATATYLDIWLMRRVVNFIRVGYSSASYAMFQLCRDIRRKPLTELVDILYQKLNNDDVTFNGCPIKDREGINGLYLNQFSRRYIFHLLARLTAYVEAKGSGQRNQFDKYVDRAADNPYDIEHIWSKGYRSYPGVFDSDNDFEFWRNHIASLLLLPADVNRSLQDKTFEQKSPIYAKEDLYTASLAPLTYENAPKFHQFKSLGGLTFEPYKTFGKEEQMKRRELVSSLVQLVWSPDRIKEVLY